MDHLKEFARAVWHAGVFDAERTDTRADAGTNSSFEDWYRDFTAGYDGISLPIGAVMTLQEMIINQRQRNNP